MQFKNLEELIASDQTVITAAQAAPFINADPCTIRLQARERPELLGFPVCVCGSYVKIPRLPFIEFLTKMPPLKVTIYGD